MGLCDKMFSVMFFLFIMDFTKTHTTKYLPLYTFSHSFFHFGGGLGIPNIKSPCNENVTGGF